MGHEIGEVEEISVYQTIDGKVFDSQELATAHEENLVSARNTSKINKLKEDALKKLAGKYFSVNKYYGVLNGILYRGGEADEVLKSLMLETPETTLKLLISLDEVEYGEDGPIKGELPKPVGDEDEFVEKEK